MALTGAFLLLFVTFHCVMNAVAILWPAAYNVICEFLGANWYALIGSAIIAVFVLLHIILAIVLTVQNRKARGTQRYSISRYSKAVEWSSRNMFVLGIVILAFLVVHLIQFWAKMQLVEACGEESVFPPAAGTLFLQEAFSQPWTLVVYVIGFIALWFHLNHGFWSMFQSIGWNNATWLPRLKCISCWWVSIVVALFLAEAVCFTVRANEGYYKTDETLREQYKGLIADELANNFGAEGEQLASQIDMLPFEQVSMGLRQMDTQMSQQWEQMNSEQGKLYLQNNPDGAEQLKEVEQRVTVLNNVVKFLDYLEGDQNKPEMNLPGAPGQPY